jgi:hypothetical protein
VHFTHQLALISTISANYSLSMHFFCKYFNKIKDLGDFCDVILKKSLEDNDLQQSLHVALHIAK